MELNYRKNSPRSTRDGFINSHFSTQGFIMTLRNVFVFLTVLSLIGCASMARIDAVPKAQQDAATVLGVNDVRYRVGAPGMAAAIEAEALQSAQREQDYRKAQGITGPLPPSNFLAISGGGDNGAFGAGLLNGWTAAGTRPEFRLVTGVSTGALMAPFAFLGPDYDRQLRDFYTNTTEKDILIKRSIVSAVFSDALADTSPLWARIEKEITPELLDKIAAEYQKGRILFIGTTDLDARQGVIWNMTKIAASKDPNAIKLFRSIMIASASIPGAFPPVMIDVTVDGKHYQEMHVDGGTIAQVFVYPSTLHVKKLSAKHNMTRKRNLYLIRNSRLDPDWSNTERKVMSIAGRSISSLIHTQGLGDLLRIYITSKRDDVSYNLAYIPPTFNVEHQADFDANYMRPLFQMAYDLAKNGYPWQKTPPGFEPD